MGKRIKFWGGFGRAVVHPKGTWKWVLCAGFALALAGCVPSNTQDLESASNMVDGEISTSAKLQQDKPDIAPQLGNDDVFKASGFINQGPYKKDRKQIYRVGHDYFIINFDHGGILLMASIREQILEYVTQKPTPMAPSSQVYKVSNNVAFVIHGSLDNTPNCASYFASIGARENTVIEFGVLVFNDSTGARKIFVTKSYRDGCPKQENGEGGKFTLQSLLNHYRTMDVHYTSETELTVEITQHPFPPRLNQ